MNILKEFNMKEILKFLAGGGSAVITDFLVYHLLIFLGTGTDISKLISYIFGATVGFSINKLWTFQSRIFSLLEILKYILLYCISAVINTFVNKVTLDIFQISVIAFLTATCISTVINFLGQKFFVFQKKS